MAVARLVTRWFDQPLPVVAGLDLRRQAMVALVGLAVQASAAAELVGRWWA